MAAFHFELVSPERLLFSGNVEAVVVPGAEGAFTVLQNHAPVMTVLKPGIVEVDETASKKARLFVRGGFADVSPAGLTILAEQAIAGERREVFNKPVEIIAIMRPHRVARHHRLLPRRQAGIELAKRGIRPVLQPCGFVAHRVRTIRLSDRAKFIDLRLNLCDRLFKIEIAAQGKPFAVNLPRQPNRSTREVP